MAFPMEAGIGRKGNNNADNKNNPDNDFCIMHLNFMFVRRVKNRNA